MSRAEHLSHDMDHTQTVTVNSLSLVILSSHSEMHSQRTDRRRPEAAHDPGGTMSCPTPTGKMPRGSQRQSIEAPR